MVEFTRSVKGGEVLLNNVPLRVEGAVTFSLENVYGRKIQQGDPGPDDHPINSTISQNSWTGGIGTKTHRGDDTRGNSWFSTFETTIQRSLSLPVKTQEISGAAFSESGSLVYVHEKLLGVTWASFGNKLKKWDEAADNVEDPEPGGVPTARATTNAPVGEGVVWGNSLVAKKLFIPTGAAYETFDGLAAPAAGEASQGAIAFAVWEQKLFKLDLAGDVKVLDPSDGIGWTLKGSIPDEGTPRGLIVFYDKDNNQVLHVITSSKTYALDYTNATLIETDMWWPDHPFQGLGYERWRADLFVSVGTGIHRNVGGQIQPVGPDGREGLPEEFSEGYFTWLQGSYNDLFGLVRGIVIPTVGTETSDAYTGPPERMLTDLDQSFALLLGFNGLGWHVKWVGQKEPTNIQVASHSGVYRVFWGVRGALMTKIIPIGYYNPLYNSLQGVPLERTAYHETPYFNWGFDDTPKIGKQFEIKTALCDDLNYIDVMYRVDDEEDWTFLASLKTNGQHHLDIGFETLGDFTFAAGLPHERIQFRLEGHGNAANTTQTPIVEWYTLVGRKWMRMIRTFRFQVDLGNPKDGKSVKVMHDAIMAATMKKGAVPLVIDDEIFIVDITTDSGNQKTGKSKQRYHNIVAVESTEIEDA